MAVVEEGGSRRTELMSERTRRTTTNAAAADGDGDNDDGDEGDGGDGGEDTAFSLLVSSACRSSRSQQPEFTHCPSPRRCVGVGRKLLGVEGVPYTASNVLAKFFSHLGSHILKWVQGQVRR